jgi:signal transduction histidine kinase/CheY-like chemotaxis protein
MNPPSASDIRDIRDMDSSRKELQRENATLRERLREAEETLNAIRNGDVDAVVVSGNDNVARVYTLKTADESYRLLVQEMQEGALTLTRTGDILYCNTSWSRLVNSESGKVIGGSLRNFVTADRWPAVLRMIKGESTGEIEIIGALGISVPVHISFSALRGGNFADVEIYCCIVTDLSEQRRTSDQLRSTHEALLLQVAEREHTERLLRQSQKMEAVGQLTGGIAHDFNNLLMVIAGGLSILDRDPEPELRRKLQSGMRQAAERGATLTRQLLAFSRQKELHARPVIISRHVEGMRELLDGALGGDISVKTQFDADVWAMQVDEGELEIALLNLCVNARDAMPNGGTITIAARNRRDFAEFQLKGDFVEVSVTDTGGGMDAETVSRCLEPFYTTKDVGKGSGLGLAQVYGFVQGSAGAVQIESKPQEGTTVLLFLPRAPKDTSPLQNAQVEFQGEPPRCKVLLVEDDPAVASLTEEMLQELGYQVTHVESSLAGLRALATDRGSIGLVMSDVMMPGGMDGLSFAREIRKTDVRLPIVLVSGYAEAVRREAENAGIPLLAKPYRIDELARALASVLIRRDQYGPLP